MLHPVAGCTNNHHTDSKASKVLLELNTLVRREEDNKPVLDRTAQELTILESAPALLLNGPTPVAGELAGELPRKRLV